jgi:hypothetical protein
MDQLKDILRQCVKYRFWIAFGVSLLLPMIGYFVGVGGIVSAKDKAQGEITKAKSEIGKYTAPGIVNGQYQPLAAQKNLALVKDVDESWRELRAIQEPLLRWPEEVAPKFLLWGRKYPTDVDPGEVTRTLVDYTFAYPNFVSQIYKVFKPFNYEDGTGIVVAPDEASLLKPVDYSSHNAPDLTKVWADQERLWVVTALLDAIARINETVKAKDWDGAIVKEIRVLEVGSPSDMDQKSIAEGITPVPADPLTRPGAPAPAAAPGAGGLAAPGTSGGGMAGPGGSANQSGEVYFVKNDSKQFKVLPFKMTVLVEQSKIPDFLVGLENSPITIEVKEPDIVRPSGPVVKPVAGERSSNGGMKSGDGPGGMGIMGAPGGARNRPPGGPAGPAGGMKGPGVGGAMGGPGGGTAKGGVDARGRNLAKERKEAEKKENKGKAEPKAAVDQYYNIVEVTVYGQARFYLAPPPPEPTASTSAPGAGPAPSPTMAPGAPKAGPNPTPTPPPTAGDAPKAGAPDPR